MFKDINFDCIDGTENYTFEVIDGEVLISLETEGYKEFLLYYDENIYDDIKVLNDVKIENDDKGIVIKDINDEILKVRVVPNYKYFMKRAYQFINRFISNDLFLEELRLFKEFNVAKEYMSDLDDLINNIDSKELEELLLDGDKELDRVEYVLLNSKIYNTLADKMSLNDLMLLIVSYLSAPRVYKVPQDVFNELVKCAIQSKFANEYVWRLAMNYDFSGYDYSLIDEYFVKEKNVYYLVEYLTAVTNVNHSKVIDLILEDNDKEFIKGILDDEFIYDNIDNELIEKLKNALK